MLKPLMRAATQDDIPFIYNSWLKSFKEGSPWARHITNTVYYANHKKVIQSLLNKSQVVIACNPDDETQILGYVCFTPGPLTFVHYLYVKVPYRKLSIGKSLMLVATTEHSPTLPILATHVTNIWNTVLKVKWNMFYNPYILEVFYET
jgi:ribosomal protein S18 acetylase RimI-like enzyme